MGDQKFLLIVSDVDELPRKSIIAEASPSYEKYSKPYHLENVLFYYNFKWMVPETWIKQFIVNDKCLREFSNTDSIDSTRLTPSKQIIKNAGWHCSYCFNSTEISRKIRSFSHQEFNTSYYTNITRIEKCVELGLDLYDRFKDKPFINYKGLSIKGQHSGYPECDKRYDESPLVSILALPNQ
jgi:hypothetical protein